ncbi:MAG TPA: ESX secretion-associated protein EspG [Actinophytocola sp.]|uniref:ESX secretion-associated protein EspG n=1 Tax=Actinophytocola sp. TaxID=1872138 RepID=UPI002DBE9514|nr:ESX secretion-associated protein EspG [Actinophytocola sp.]HEU5471738.1 ESX secretion-associated protein EspG [Actinophytocola sp.]
MAVIGELSLPMVDILWADLELGTLPFPLQVSGHGDTAEERDRIRRAVYTELERRDLALYGRIGADLDYALRLLAAPTISIDLVALPELTDPLPVRAVVAARGKRAVLAVQRELNLRLAMVRHSAIAASIVDLLPPNRYGPGPSVTLPAAQVSRAPARVGRHRRDEPGGAVLRTATRQADRTAEQRWLDTIMERPVLRAGSFGLVLRDEHGKPQRLPGFGFFDTDQGRYATSVSHGVDGEDWTTLAPSDNPRLAHRLNELMLAALRE